MFIVMSLGLSGRMVYLNVTERAFLQGQGDARSLRYETLPANRGIIFDRNGEPLAVSTPVVSVWIDPTQTRTIPRRSRTSRARSAWTARTRQRSSNGTRSASSCSSSAVSRRRRSRASQNSHIDGVHFEREYRRYYPAGETAAHVVGITNVDDQGQEGAELAFEEDVEERPGPQTRAEEIGSGEAVKDVEYLTAPRFGHDLALSLDLRLQFFAYRELKSAIDGASREVRLGGDARCAHR